MHLVSPIRKRAEDHASAAPDIEDSRSVRDARGDEGDVASTHGANQPLDQGLKLYAGLPVIFIGVVASNGLGIGQRMQSPQPALVADGDTL